MRPLKIALLQIAPCGGLEENLEKGIRACRKAKKMGADIALFPACRKAKKMGADIALFPEMWSNGYNMREARAIRLFFLTGSERESSFTPKCIPVILMWSGS